MQRQYECSNMHVFLYTFVFFCKYLNCWHAQFMWPKSFTTITSNLNWWSTVGLAKTGVSKYLEKSNIKFTIVCCNLLGNVKKQLTYMCCPVYNVFVYIPLIIHLLSVLDVFLDRSASICWCCSNLFCKSFNSLLALIKSVSFCFNSVFNLK